MFKERSSHSEKCPPPLQLLPRKQLPKTQFLQKGWKGWDVQDRASSDSKEPGEEHELVSPGLARDDGALALGQRFLPAL